MAFRKLVSLTTDHLYSILFVVEGSGRFPAEMLAVDRCLPRTKDDAAGIGDRFGRRRVELVAYQQSPNWLPSIRHWDEMQWRVIDMEEHDQPHAVMARRNGVLELY